MLISSIVQSKSPAPMLPMVNISVVLLFSDKTTAKLFGETMISGKSSDSISTSSTNQSSKPCPDPVVRNLILNPE